MKKLTLLFLCLCLSGFISCSKQVSLQEGDIIFQTSRSPQSKAVQMATNSKYSHMGIIFFKDGAIYVLEAAEPVKYTPLGEWITRGEGSRCSVKRLKDADKLINEQTVRKMKNVGEGFLGKHYDPYFEWSDDRIYCSELVWKIYGRALNVEIGELAGLGSFDLSSAEVKNKLEERFGDNIPLDEKVISPASMYNSKKLIKIVEK